MKESDIQLEAKKVLLDQGYVYWFPPKIRFYQRDIFGIFDFVAARKEEILFVQLTTVQHISDRRRKITAFMADHYCSFANAWIWAWNKEKGSFKVVKTYEEFI